MPPHRVQVSRARGWKMPANTVKIDRTTKWGNPFKIGLMVTDPVSNKHVKIDSAETSIAMYTKWLKSSAAGRKIAAEARRELEGRNLACWCKPGSPCHGDVLLEVANG